MLTVVIIMACGMLIGYLLHSYKRILAIADNFTNAAIYLLLLLLGVAIGLNNSIMLNLSTLGVKALIVSIAGVLGSILLALPVYLMFFKKRELSTQVKPQHGTISFSSLKGSLIILAFFATGVVLGYLRQTTQDGASSNFSTYTLYLLMFCVGVGIGADQRAMNALKNFNLNILLVPLTTVVGTLSGVAFTYTFVDGLKLTEILAIGSGFGYYSLSSIIITELSSPEIGVIALLANVIREIITLLFAPVFSKYFGKLAPIVSGGATSMDTTLPIISIASGKEYAVISLFHGIVLTILVPFIVTLFLKL